MCTEENIKIYSLESYLKLKEDGIVFKGESYLFWEYMRILNELRKINPNIKFMLENVEMGHKNENTFTNAIGINGIHINAALVSAQNRKRIYWTNIKSFDNFFTTVCDIPQPKDMNIKITDILEDNVDEKYYYTKERIQKVFIDNGMNNDDRLISELEPLNLKKNRIIFASRGRNPDNINERKSSNGKYRQRIEFNFNNKANTLTTLCTDNLLMEYSLENDFSYRIRELTPTEYSRLQTIPKWYKWGCKESAIYKMCGLGWNINVIKHIFSFL